MPDFHSAYDGKITSGRGKRRFNDDDPTSAKRVRGRRALPPIEQCPRPSQVILKSGP